MSSPTEVGPPARGSGLWVKVGLVLSLIVNFCVLAFLVGFFAASLGLAGPGGWHPFQPDPGARFETRVMQRVNLDDAQRRAFHESKRAINDARRLLRDANEPINAQILAEELKTPPDQGRITALLAQAEQNRQQFEQSRTQAFASFLATLNPQQRTAFGELIEDRRDHRPEHPRHRPEP